MTLQVIISTATKSEFPGRNILRKFPLGNRIIRWVMSKNIQVLGSRPVEHISKLNTVS